VKCGEIERDDDGNLSDGHKSTISSCTIWIVDAGAAQCRVYVCVDKIAAGENPFGLDWQVNCK
jgi:hypothetical protein